MISAALSAGGAQSTRIGIASTVIGVDSPSAPINQADISPGPDALAAQTSLKLQTRPAQGQGASSMTRS